jgi:hypothetical protein
MSDRLRSWIRTVMPGAWAALVVLLVKLGLPAGVADWLTSNGVSDAVTNLVGLAVVYGFIRWIEPHIPDSLTRIFLGSAAPPTYTREG